MPSERLVEEQRKDQDIAQNDDDLFPKKPEELFLSCSHPLFDGDEVISATNAVTYIPFSGKNKPSTKERKPLFPEDDEEASPALAMLLNPAPMHRLSINNIEGNQIEVSLDNDLIIIIAARDHHNLHIGDRLLFNDFGAASLYIKQLGDIIAEKTVVNGEVVFDSTL